MFKNAKNVNIIKYNTEKLHLLEILKGLWQEISINIIWLLPKSNNKDAIVVIVDQFTQMIRLKAITTVVSLEEVA